MTFFSSCIAYRSKYLSHFEKRDDDKTGCSGKALPVIIALTSQMTQQGSHLKMKNIWMAQWIQTKGFPFNVHCTGSKSSWLNASLLSPAPQTPRIINTLGQERSNHIVSKFTDQAKHTETICFSLLIRYVFSSFKKGELLVSSRLSSTHFATPQQRFQQRALKGKRNSLFLYYLKGGLL